MRSFDVDVLVIGAGVLGCMTARELARYQVDVMVAERAFDVCEGSSKANSGLIHAGFHPREYSLKGLSCVEGNKSYDALCEELGVPFKRTGSLYVSFGPVGLERLHEKLRRGQANGVQGLRIISGDEARAIEPRLSGEVECALWEPNTGIISPFVLTIALYESALSNGVSFCFQREVSRLERIDAGWRAHFADGSSASSRFVVNAAGDAAEMLDAQVHAADLVVRPRRGQYYVFDKQKEGSAITHPVMQSQETDEKGTLVTPTIEGNLLIGPTSENVRSYTRTETTAQGLAHAQRVAEKLFPDLDMGEVIASFAGVRANIRNVEKERKDFVVRCSAPGFVSALGIKNPGMTSSPALARRIVALLEKEGLPLVPNEQFVAKRTPRVRFLERSERERAALMGKDARFATVLCRCERVTEGDVLALARDASCPRTFESVKHRLRIGMGRCQGSRCTSRVLALLAQEWKMAEEDIPFTAAGGRYSFGKVK